MTTEDLTERIAEVLGAHHPAYRVPGQAPVFTPGGWPACVCGWRGRDHATHQAEQVRAVLGETTTEWHARISAVQAHLDETAVAYEHTFDRMAKSLMRREPNTDITADDVTRYAAYSASWRAAADQVRALLIEVP